MMSMNGGNIGKVVEGLKVQPMSLALIVLTAVFMYFIYSGITANRRDIHEVLKVMVERCVQQQGK
jgi:hypothetical protein